MATIILSSGFLCACGITKESDTPTTEPETTTFKEVETTTEQEEETTFNLFTYPFKGRIFFLLNAQYGDFTDKIANLVVKPGEIIYVNDYAGSEEDDGLRGSIAYAFMFALYPEGTDPFDYLSEYVKPHEVLEIPLEDNFYVENISGHTVMFEPVHKTDNEDCYFDIYYID